jgi:hypothetical protein
MWQQECCGEQARSQKELQLHTVTRWVEPYMNVCLTANQFETVRFARRGSAGPASRESSGETQAP